MEEMRVQIEAREPTDGEIRAFWFTLPIDTEQVEELLGIDVDTDYYYITGKELPFANEVQEDTTVEKLNDLYATYENLHSDLKEDYAELMCYFTDLDELHLYRNDIIHYSWCKNMTDVARHIMNNDPDFTALSESFTRYFDFEAYGRDMRINEGGHFAPTGYLTRSGDFKEVYHGIEDIPAEHRIFAYPKLNIREQMAAYKEIIDRSSLEGERLHPRKEHDDR